MFNYRGATALITGASSGLGEHFADALAGRGCDLILTARSTEKLETVAARAAEKYKVRTSVIRADLSQAGAAEEIYAETQRRGLSVDLLINNAGFGYSGAFASHELARERDQIQVNIEALVELTRLFVPAMAEKRKGGVINVSSSAAFQPLPYFAVYGATKVFVLSFSEAIGRELAASNVHVMAVCPGPVATNFFATMNPTMNASSMDTPEKIVQQAMRAFDKRRQVVIPGKIGVKLGAYSTRLFPRAWVARIAAVVSKKMFA